jgi:hypothetical protein
VLSVFDQLSWTQDTEASVLLQLVSTQLDAQEEIRQRIRHQLAKDYPASALAWLPTVTWSAPTLVPLTSFDLRGIAKWPTWDDKKKIATFTEKIKSGWHKPIVSIKVPGARHLLPIDGHTRLSVYWKLKRPPYAWVGKAHSVNGPWEHFHRQQRGMSMNQKEAGFANGFEPVAELTEEMYQQLLAERRDARSLHVPGHPERVAAERAVRQARRVRSFAEPSERVTELATPKTTVISSGSDAPHAELLSQRRAAQDNYPAGHPERVRAERAVRQSRARLKQRQVSDGVSA